jgi:two-component system invasion response regulator UvrY
VTIRLLIADDHAIVRHGLRQIVSGTSDIVVQGEAENGREVLRMLREDEFDVLLLDISMPEKNGLEVLAQAKRELPKLAVIVLSMHAEDEFGVRALKGGASGYVSKQTAAKELVEAIRKVASGRKYISPALAEELANHVSNESDGPLHRSLSTREYQTLCLIASGKSLSQVAQELLLSPKTVSVYRARLLEKLKLSNNAELTHYAIRNKLVNLNGAQTVR